MERYLAQTVIDNDGRYHRLAVLTLPGDGTVSIEPFEKETAATVFVNGTLVIGSALPAGYRRVKLYCRQPEIWLCRCQNSANT